MTITQDEKLITDPEQIKKDDTLFAELTKKEQRTPEEEKELGEVKERYGKRMQKKIDKLSFETKTEKEARFKAEEEAEKLRKENEELKKGKEFKPDVAIKEKFVEIGGQKFYTDETLVNMIDAGKVTENEAYKYQRNRDRFEDRILLRQDIEKDKTTESANVIRKEDAEQVMKDYPHFAKNHADFNPDDPLYKLTTEIYAEGYAANPKGLSLAIKRAKQILKLTDTQVDRTDDLSLDDNTPPDRPRKKERDITLSEQEKETAERLYRNKVNLKTGRTYTEKESHVKALEAKKSRQQKREE